MSQSGSLSDNITTNPESGFKPGSANFATEHMRRHVHSNGNSNPDHSNIQARIIDSHAQKYALRHSKRVQWLKILFPSLGIGLALLVIAWFIISRSLGPEFSLLSAGFNGQSLTMDSPTLSGFNKGRAFEVSAKKATQSLETAHIIKLDQIHARFAIDGKNWVTVDARDGEFDRESEILNLATNIVAKVSTGYQMDLSTARINLKEGTLSSDAPVHITSKRIDLKADGLQVDQKADTILFVGNVFMLIQPESSGTQ
ncbi:MAG: LPS export ABC transporter periplasmic protein LptC [Cohaesibacteraceae bacterium]|nr:LPS export ABC transporter periplasmic protein LptC [Cohaesibacteraceae bacterium]MBL4875114.1 LPS export ABC transporter periplasmic protein LptC [Cohaesibacteraceae bacterium]